MRHEETWKLETEPRPRHEKNHVSRQSRDKTHVSRLNHWLKSSYQVVKLRQLLVVVRSTVVRDPLLQRNGGDYDVQVKW